MSNQPAGRSTVPVPELRIAATMTIRSSCCRPAGSAGVSEVLLPEVDAPELTNVAGAPVADGFVTATWMTPASASGVRASAGVDGVRYCTVNACDTSELGRPSLFAVFRVTVRLMPFDTDSGIVNDVAVDDTHPES